MFFLYLYIGKRDTDTSMSLHFFLLLYFLMYQFHGPVKCFPLQSVSVLVVHSGDCELSIRSDTKNDVRSTVTEDDPGHNRLQGIDIHLFDRRRSLPDPVS